MSSLLVGLALTVGAPKLKEPPSKGPPLVGRWECTDLTRNGKDNLQGPGLEYEFTPEGGWMVYRVGKDIGGIGRRYKVDPKAGPGAVDLFERDDGVALPSLYKVDGATLILSIRTDKGNRPTDFEPGEGLSIFTFSRVKPKG
jgi:uncharacterized protein (TIGR03067 family)